MISRKNDFVRFTEGHGVRMARAVISTEGLVGHFCNVRSAHYDGDTSGANRVSDPVCLCYHPGHRPDSDQSDVLFPHESRDASFIDRSRVAIA
ncbi:MAG: hypothetical protein WA197_03510 [Candidatus Acidiferrales bacterium]